MLQRKLEQGAVELAPGVTATAYSPVMLTCYPHILDDLNLLQSMLHDLGGELAAVAATVLRHGSSLQKIEAAGQALANLRSESPTRNELVARLRSVFQSLAGVEDDLASCGDTVSQHGLKLQHIDLISQLLTSIIVGAALGGELDPLTRARLQNLRACCNQTLSGTAAPLVSFRG